PSPVGRRKEAESRRPAQPLLAGRYHTECRGHHRARALQYAQRLVRSLRYPGVCAVEHESPEGLRPEDARRMGDEAETILCARKRLSILQYQLPAYRDDHRIDHERQRWNQIRKRLLEPFGLTQT